MGELWSVRAALARGQKGDTNVTEEAAGSVVPSMALVYRPAAMSSSFVLRASLVGMLLFCGCGDDGRPSGTAGSDSALVGGACTDNSECEKGLCQSGAAFPGSLCTLSCGSSNNCPSGSSCAQLETGWICLVNCADTSDCREQWACETLTEAGTGDASTVSVCIGAAPAS